MSTMNHVYISGYVTRDAELRFVSSGTPLCSFSIGVPRSWQQSGQWKKETSFIDCKAWGELAEHAGEQLHKGVGILVQGRSQQERWETEEGNVRSRLVVVADHVQVVGQSKARNSNDDLPF